jgi:MraZ protein
MDEAAQDASAVEPPRGMYPGRMDDRGRLKLAATFVEYLNKLPEKKLFVTSLDRRIAQIYPIGIWRENERFFATYRGDPVNTRKVQFNAQDLGAEAEMDSQGRVLVSPELRRELGLENQTVRTLCVNGRIQILSETIYQEMKTEASTNAQQAVEDLERVGLK